jgi:hypothetical protein
MARYNFSVAVEAAVMHVVNACGITAEDAIQWSASINLYTKETPLYGKLNCVMRDRKREPLEPFLPYLKLLLFGFYQCPLEKASVVFRGIKGPIAAELAAKYKAQAGRECIWWSVSSCTETISVLENPMFLGKAGDRVEFTIEDCLVIRIAELSSIPEDEVILLPGTRLTIKDVADRGNGLFHVHMKQHPSGYPLDFKHPAAASLLLPSGSAPPKAVSAKADGRRLTEDAHPCCLCPPLNPVSRLPYARNCSRAVIIWLFFFSCSCEFF